MNLNELADELRTLAAKAREVAEEADRPEIREPVRALTDACTTVGFAWSGSWIGYQARVYYRDFQQPPAGAHFSIEWGVGSSVGDWLEYRYEEVIRAIEDIGGTSDLSAVEAYRDKAKPAFANFRSDAISILTTTLSDREDAVIKGAIEELAKLDILTQSIVIAISRPTTLVSRDRRAIDGGGETPAHIAYTGGLVERIDPGRVCGEVANIAERTAEHLARVTRAGGTQIRQRGKRVVIAHGRSPVWREFKDFLVDRLSLQYEEFNRVPVAGVATSDRLQQMLDSSGIGFAVLTAEDETTGGHMVARQNVIHEAGLFQGCYGFKRGIIVLEDGCDEFSNIEGLGQIRFPSGDISSCFDEVRQTLEREGFIE